MVRLQVLFSPDALREVLDVALEDGAGRRRDLGVLSLKRGETVDLGTIRVGR